MKKILFPTDFSDAANTAFQYALPLARQMKAEIITVHAYSLPDIRGAHLPNTLKQVYKSITLEEFENYRDSVPVLHTMADEAGYTDIQIRHAMIEGNPVKVVLNTIRDEDIDIVVMGTKGTGWLREVFVGSVAAEVLEQAPCPVLAVPLESRFDGTIDHIAFAIEINEEEKALIWELLKFADYFEAVVTCLHVDVSHTEAYSQHMRSFAEEFADVPNLRFQVVGGTDTLEAVAAYVEGNKFDIVAMTTHKRNFWQELWNYSMTKQMTRIVKAPIYVVKAG